jgi:hypothetical protein
VTGPELLIAIISGLAVNECCDLSPALARVIVRWSARRHYRNPARAAERAEELAAYINDRPGKLFKLIVAVHFAAAALVTCRELRGSTLTAPSFQPARSVTVEFSSEKPYDPGTDDGLWFGRIGQMKQAWQAIEGDVKVAARPAARRGDLQARLSRLAEATGDSRWDLIAANIAQLQHPAGHFSKPVHRDGANLGQFGYAPGITVAEPVMVPAESTVNTYLAAAKQIRDDIRELAR